MPWQSLRITRRLPCDTLPVPEKRTNDMQTAQEMSRLIFCIGNYPPDSFQRVVSAICFQIPKLWFRSEVSKDIAPKGEHQKENISQHEKMNCVLLHIRK